MPDSAKSDFLVDCNSLNDNLPQEQQHNYTMCRKLHMFMDQKYTDGESWGSLHIQRKDMSYI